jgi:hypothetical protein
MAVRCCEVDSCVNYATVKFAFFVNRELKVEASIAVAIRNPNCLEMGVARKLQHVHVGAYFPSIFGSQHRRIPRTFRLSRRTCNVRLDCGKHLHMFEPILVSRVI